MSNDFDFETISAEKARSGERVTLDFNQGGLGVAFEVDGELWGAPGIADWAPKVDEDQGGGFDVIRDGGDAYDGAYNLDMSGLNVEEGNPVDRGVY